VWHLFGRNTSRRWDGRSVDGVAKPIPPGNGEPINEDERKTFIEWIDMGAVWTGVPNTHD
jgi:hypothetical protein